MGNLLFRAGRESDSICLRDGSSTPARTVYLPQHILIEILSWLPVKSLLRFRSLSKSWLSLISTPDFAKLQFKRASALHKIIDLDRGNIRSIDCESSSSFHYRSPSRLLELPFIMPRLRFNILGSCNGLICVGTRSRRHELFYLWNPCTNEYKKIPGLNYEPHMRFVEYGFGYDSTTDDYKLLIVTSRCDRTSVISRNSDPMVNLFSLKRGTWRRFVDTTYFKIWLSPGFGIFLNDAIHWISETLTKHAKIVAFGLAKESFSTIPVPAFCPKRNCLSVLDGHLCLSSNIPRSPHTIWMMKEYSVNSSWIKFISIDFRHSLCYPLCLTRRGEIVFTNMAGALASFDIETKSLKVIARTDNFNQFDHVDTLISPNASTTETTNKRKKIGNFDLCRCFNY